MYCINCVYVCVCVVNRLGMELNIASVWNYNFLISGGKEFKFTVYSQIYVHKPLYAHLHSLALPTDCGNINIPVNVSSKEKKDN